MKGDTGGNYLSNCQRQDLYIRALTTHRPEIKVEFGHMVKRTIMVPLYEQLLRGSHEIVKVQRHEEKQTDVNLALELYRDCSLDKCDCAVLVSNDVDLAKALKLAKSDFTKQIGLIPPLRSNKPRYISNDLREHTDFVKLIRTNNLSSSQLPDVIPGTNLRKPVDW